ncbi:MAG TPA: hypothetical protein VMH83_03635 [Candidatus Acidoferrum sp.]|nr:hypothetical protein [Candidatus Acidoferrum sp.]
MKKTAQITALALALLAPVLHAQTGIDGNWNFTANSPQGDMQIAFDLKAEKGGALSGAMSMPMMPDMKMPISDGKINGKDVSFKVKMQTPGGDMTLSYSGKLDGDSLTLQTKMEGMPAGAPEMPQMPPVVAKREKAAAAPAPAKK